MTWIYLRWTTFLMATIVAALMAFEVYVSAMPPCAPSCDAVEGSTRGDANGNERTRWERGGELPPAWQLGTDGMVEHHVRMEISFS